MIPEFSQLCLLGRSPNDVDGFDVSLLCQSDEHATEDGTSSSLDDILALWYGQGIQHGNCRQRV